MIRLAIDTSTMTQSIAVEKDDELLALRNTRLRIGHSETLLTSVERILQDLDLHIDAVDEIICGLGPGSFTGVRIGLSFGLGVAAAKEIPLFGVNSMRAFLAYVPETLQVAVALDARKSEVYGAIYTANAERRSTLAPSTYPPEEFFKKVDERREQGIVCVGDGAHTFASAFESYHDRIEQIGALRTPPADGLLAAHKRGWSLAHATQALEPRYIRPSDAEKSRT